ncbi:MAG: FHA domain-containing protein [Actinomycetes bacterium]|jgi:hypothetical protein|nr:FHA domain-containing protein [Actinomycetes bacterium]
MKTCPLCGAKASDEAATCFECYYSFAEMSARMTEENDAQIRRREIRPVLITPPLPDRCLKVELRRAGRLLRRVVSRRGSIYVGSRDYNDIVLVDNHISERHLHLYRSEGYLYAELLNGQTSLIIDENAHASPAKISDGACIELTDWSLTVQGSA